MVPGRTRLVGGVMFGGVGLTMANAEVEGVALTAPRPVRAHAPSVEARRALSARRPTDAVIISPPLAPAGYWTWSKFATQFYDRWRSPARSGGDLTHPHGWRAAPHQSHGLNLSLTLDGQSLRPA